MICFGTLICHRPVSHTVNGAACNVYAGWHICGCVGDWCTRTYSDVDHCDPDSPLQRRFVRATGHKASVRRGKLDGTQAWPCRASLLPHKSRQQAPQQHSCKPATRVLAQEVMFGDWDITYCVRYLPWRIRRRAWPGALPGPSGSSLRRGC